MPGCREANVLLVGKEGCRNPYQKNQALSNRNSYPVRINGTAEEGGSFNMGFYASCLFPDFGYYEYAATNGKKSLNSLNINDTNWYYLFFFAFVIESNNTGQIKSSVCKDIIHHV